MIAANEHIIHRLGAILVALCLVLACVLMPAVPTAFAAAADDDPIAAVDDEAGFGLTNFTRMQVGTSKDTSFGPTYAYTVGRGAECAAYLVAIATDDKVIVYVDPASAQKAGIDLADEGACVALRALIEQLDAEVANGGDVLTGADRTYVFTSEPEYVDGDYTYRFVQELGEDYYYATFQIAGAESSRGVTRFCDVAALLPADEVTVATSAGFFADAGKFMSRLDWRPLWVSVKTSVVAMIFIFILGLVAAWRTMNVKSRWKSVMDTVFTIPMVLPPTVCGFILLLIFGKSTGFGQFLINHGIDLVFTWPAAVLAAVVVGFPLMYRTVLGAFESLDNNMLDAARTLGWSEGRIFRTLMLPLAWPSIASGTVLGFARAMGEFGCTLFFAGNFAGVTQTMPIAIYFAWMGGSKETAVFWAIVVIIISFLIIMIINLYSSHVQKFRKKNASGVDEDIAVSGEGEPAAAVVEVEVAGEETR